LWQILLGFPLFAPTPSRLANRRAHSISGIRDFAACVSDGLDQSHCGYRTTLRRPGKFIRSSRSACSPAVGSPPARDGSCSSAAALHGARCLPVEPSGL